jgi:hypothetical protein
MPTTTIKDRATLKDHIHDWMIQNCPSYSVDTLLSWPDQAAEMGRAVCRKMQRKATAENIHEVCRAALQSRKCGELRLDRA